MFSSGGYSFPVDVFAAAVLLWELLGRTKLHRVNCLAGLDPMVAVDMVRMHIH